MVLVLVFNANKRMGFVSEQVFRNASTLSLSLYLSLSLFFVLLFLFLSLSLSLSIAPATKVRDNHHRPNGNVVVK